MVLHDETAIRALGEGWTNKPLANLQVGLQIEAETNIRS